MGPEFALALARSEPRGQGGGQQEKLRMTLGPSNRRDEPLHVVWMALALVLAAALGGAAGVIWQWIGFGSTEEVAPVAEK
jgi:hypothetical protein